MFLVENAQHEKIFACQLLCSSLLFSFRELKLFLQNLCSRSSKNSLSVSKIETQSLKLDSQSSKIETRNSKLEPRNLILDSRKLRGSRIEFRVETVNLHLSSTVQISMRVSGPDYMSQLARLLQCAEMTFSLVLHEASQPDGWCDEPQEIRASLILNFALPAVLSLA